MPTLFPGANDSFAEPAAPSSTTLDDDGGSGRDMVDNHEDLGLAIMAMQAQATYLAHTHDGTTKNGPKLTQARTHESADTDTGASSLHHTIGTGANQGAAGNHSHSAATVWPVGAVFITEVAGNPGSAPHNLPGTWTQMTGEFIVAAGSTFTAGTTGGGTSHTHTASFNSTGGHTHTSAATSSTGSHSHIGNDTGTSSFSHSNHPTSSSGSGGSDTVSENAIDNSYVVPKASHTHTNGSSTSTSHSHPTGTTGSDGTHTHTVSAVDSEADHGHTTTIASAANINLPAYLVVYMWYRSA